MQENDVILLRHYVENHSQDAFAEIVRRNMDAVYSSALRRVGGDAHMAKDVAQDVFVSLAHHAESLAHYACLTGWLFTSTRNAAANRIRQEIRRRTREKEATAMDEIQSDTGDELAWNRVAPFIEYSIDKLGKRDRLAILLRFFEHRTFPEIGAALQISPDGARLRVDRALEKLRTQLARKGIRSTATAMGFAIAQHAVTAAPAELHGTVTTMALQMKPSVWTKALNLAQSFRPAEITMIAIALLSMGIAIYLGQEANRTTEKIGALRTTEQQTLSRSEERLKDLEQRRKNIDPAAANQPQTIKRTPPLPPSAEQPLAPTARLAGGRRTELAAHYNSFYLALDLNPEQISHFEAIRLRESASSAIWVFDQTVPADDQPPLSSSQIEQQLRALLGNDGYEKYISYNRTIPAKAITAQLASSVYLSDPISHEQCEQLTELLAKSSTVYQAGGTIDLADLNWETVFAAAPQILTPAQIAALESVHKQSEFQCALRSSLNEQAASTRTPSR